MIASAARSLRAGALAVRPGVLVVRAGVANRVPRC